MGSAAACRGGPHSSHKEAPLTVTQIDPDDDRLAEATRLSGANSGKGTANPAQPAYATRGGRVAAVDHYAAVAEGWDHEGRRRLRAAGKAPAA